jgi:hypothetical protein
VISLSLSLSLSLIEMREHQLDQIDISDPDIMLLRFGGFVNYDRDGRVIGVRAVTENRTQHMLMFGPPEFLRPEDVDRFVTDVMLLFIDLCSA